MKYACVTKITFFGDKKEDELWSVRVLIYSWSLWRWGCFMGVKMFLKSYIFHISIIIILVSFTDMCNTLTFKGIPLSFKLLKVSWKALHLPNTKMTSCIVEYLVFYWCINIMLDFTIVTRFKNQTHHALKPCISKRHCQMFSSISIHV